jgi:hypothetical protein
MKLDKTRMHCRRPGQQKRFIEVVCSEPAKIKQASKKKGYNAKRCGCAIE